MKKLFFVVHAIVATLLFCPPTVPHRDAQSSHNAQFQERTSSSLPNVQITLEQPKPFLTNNSKRRSLPKTPSTISITAQNVVIEPSNIEILNTKNSSQKPTRESLYMPILPPTIREIKRYENYQSRKLSIEQELIKKAEETKKLQAKLTAAENQIHILKKQQSTSSMAPIQPPNIPYRPAPPINLNTHPTIIKLRRSQSSIEAAKEPHFNTFNI